jgi:hypothetical protein
MTHISPQFNGNLVEALLGPKEEAFEKPNDTYDEDDDGEGVGYDEGDDDDSNSEDDDGSFFMGNCEELFRQILVKPEFEDEVGEVTENVTDETEAKPSDD